MRLARRRRAPGHWRVNLQLVIDVNVANHSPAMTAQSACTSPSHWAWLEIETSPPIRPLPCTMPLTSSAPSVSMSPTRRVCWAINDGVEPSRSRRRRRGDWDMLLQYPLGLGGKDAQVSDWIFRAADRGRISHCRVQSRRRRLEGRTGRRHHRGLPGLPAPAPGQEYGVAAQENVPPARRGPRLATGLQGRHARRLPAICRRACRR